MRAAATILTSLAMALCAIGLAVAAPGGLLGSAEPAAARVKAASGALSVTNSRAGSAVLSAAAMRPGTSVSGTVRIGNGGDAAGRLAVRVTDVQDMPGAQGGPLSERLLLVLTDVSGGATRFSGRPADFGEVALGTLAADEEREYRFTVTLPDGGVGDNLFQGSALSLGLQWQAAPAAAIPTPAPQAPAPKPPAQPPVRPTPTPAPTPTLTPPAADLADTIGLPAATKCVKRRRLKLRLKPPAGIVSARVAVNGRVKARLKGAKLRKAVKLRRLRKRVKLRVTLRDRDGRAYTAKRTYKRCAKRRR